MSGGFPLHLEGIVAEQAVRGGHEWRVVAASATPIGHCPDCGVPSRRIHSRYPRWLDDLPCFDATVRLQLLVRRFFCDQPSCPRRIFAERFSGVARPRSRRTIRLEETLRRLAFCAGGLPGQRLSSALRLPTSASTLLRLLRRTPPPEVRNLRVLGVDDWAFRKGQRYGTLLVDLERQQIVDLLPTRESADFARWLQKHPGIETISRDRTVAYAKAARDEAPAARQVADRWHLLKNLAEALEADLHSFLPQIHRVHRNFRERTAEPAPPPAVPAQMAMRAAARKNRQERYERVRQLHQQGWSQAEIHREMGLACNTIRAYLRGPLPQNRRPGRRQRLDGYRDRLQQRWEEGCRNGEQLWRGLQDEGYRGSLRSVQRYVVAWREAPAGAGDLGSVTLGPSRYRRVTPRQVVWWLLARKKPLDAEEQWMRDRLLTEEASVAELARLAQEFQQMLQDRRGEGLATWMVQATQAGGALKRFVRGLQQDLEAVREAFCSPWSNGQTEGQVNRLKTLKRQMYGRAGFDLLRIRLLYAPADLAASSALGRLAA